ncbi:hypothetical protein B5E41_13375 [Rhizobium esperanzae]|uniref:Transposase n=1 Tax=Rhizobium esperanzae TaxID=1967781 RepID=A0A246DWL2_9HYPH|nr:hypothetical protein B5E41_13375 [Rhizobium esperanzae]
MPTDNNILKRDIRVIATARNSWLFRDTVDGPRLAPWAPDRRSTRPRQQSRDVLGTAIASRKAAPERPADTGRK